MPVRIPSIDQQNYQEILKNALARVPVHTPEWTNLSENDPGVTILELFAFMTESLLYRSNLIPERNRRKFLSLLGLPMQPATAAQGLATFSNDRGPLRVYTVAGDLRVMAGQVPFRTGSGLDVLPIAMQVFYKHPLTGPAAEAAAADYRRTHPNVGPDTPLQFYETVQLAQPTDTSLPVVDLHADTIDQTLWFALLARPHEEVAAARNAIHLATLSLGILPSHRDQTRHLLPAGLSAAAAQAALDLSISTGRFTAAGRPEYRRLSATPDANPLADPTILTLRLPDARDMAAWPVSDPLQAGVDELPPRVDVKLASQVIAWLRVQAHPGSGGLPALINWVGHNAVRVQQREHLQALMVGRGTGEPEQVLTLPHPGVLAGTLRLTVGGTPWAEIDDLMAAGPEVTLRDASRRPGEPVGPPADSQVYTLDPEAGLVRFGDGARGARPPQGAEIQVSYAYGGGRQGNLPIGALATAALPPGVKVSNPLPTWGGLDAETVAGAEQRIAQFLKHRDRLVTREDFEDVLRTLPGIDLGRTEVVPLYHPDRATSGCPGVITILVVPKAARNALQPPEPGRMLLETIVSYLDERRLITTELFVRGPIYKPIQVSVGFEVLPGHDFPTVRSAVEAALATFLSPITGGRERKGWPLGKPVLGKELVAIVDRVPGVDHVNDLQLMDADGNPLESVPMVGLELPWLLPPDTSHGAALPPAPPPSVRPIVAPKPLPPAPAPSVRRPRPLPERPPRPTRPPRIPPGGC